MCNRGVPNPMSEEVPVSVVVSLLLIVGGGIVVLAAAHLRKLVNGLMQVRRDEQKFARLPPTD